MPGYYPFEKGELEISVMNKWFDKLVNNIESDEDLIKHKRKKLIRLKRESIRLEQARESIHIVAKQTQEILEYNLNDIVSKAMETVFDDPYEVKIEFVVKRNKTEAEIWFVRNNIKYDPLQSTGGGTVDVAAFAIKLALWSLKAKRTRKTLIFDEPFRNVNDPSRELHSRLSEMTKEICKSLGVQIIMVSLEDEMIDSADKTIRLKKIDNKSTMEVV